MSPLPINEIFLAAFKQACAFDSLNAEVQAYVKGISKQQTSDFSSPTGGYFSHESQEAISQEAAARLAKAVARAQPQNVGISLLQAEWQRVVADFYKSNSWGYSTQKQKPPKILTKDQKITRELAPYIWAVFQAWVVMKLVIYYFGMDAANNPDESHVFLYLGMAFSFCSLVYFAWRKTKKGE